ncbi:hypothetical protein TeGR_g13391 [Tetraparma gracilis]|uniref:Sulfotransferase domain-containing protein n=1 Tax=Tetraparma gracilis TaxID=2962635 RepID=A0ABQ6MTB3_9STRA|nr:hypothetical protein TeGR_g13391 [Tetraparma gracilis]
MLNQFGSSVKKAKKKKRPEPRTATFLIVGVMKASTTTAAKILSSREDISFTYNELHYFDKADNFSKGKAWYEAHFEAGKKERGEKTPVYSFYPEAIRRIHEYNPKMKLVLMLRDPVTRAYSQYNHMRQQTKKLGAACFLKVDLKKTFREYLEMDEAKDGEPVTLDKTAPQTMLRRGYYMEQIDNILKLFPKEQLLVLTQERYNADPLAENNRIFSFLNLPPLTALEPVHEHARSYEEEMLAEDKEWLAGKYAAHNEKLFEFLGYRIPEWTTPAEDQK